MAEPANWASKAAIDLWTGRAALTTTAGAALTLPRTTYLALLTAVPGDDITLATMAEVTTAGYIRQPVTWTAPAIPAGGVNYQSTNSTMVTFGPFGATMLSDAVAAVLVSAASGTTGDFIFAWPLDTPQTAAINESIQIPAGKLILAHN